MREGRIKMEWRGERKEEGKVGRRERDGRLFSKVKRKRKARQNYTLPHGTCQSPSNKLK